MTMLNPFTYEQRQLCTCGHVRRVHKDEEEADDRCHGYAVMPQPIPNGSRAADGWPLDWTAGVLCDCPAFQDEREVYRM
jgi:hypothetical protein